MNIEFLTTEEIAQELLKRTNWVGVIIQSQDTHKFPDQAHNAFNVSTNLDQASLMNMLGSIMTNLEINNFQERQQ